MNEFARAENRGRFSLSVQVLFSIGLLFVALVSVYDPLNRGVERLFLGQSRAERAEPRSSHSVGSKTGRRSRLATVSASWRRRVGASVLTAR